MVIERAATLCNVKPLSGAKGTCRVGVWRTDIRLWICPFMTKNADSLSKVIGYLIASLRKQLASLTTNLSEQFAKSSFCMLFESEFDYGRACQDIWIIGNILSFLCFKVVDSVRVLLL